LATILRIDKPINSPRNASEASTKPDCFVR
jgi:hypothetical protein